MFVPVVARNWHWSAFHDEHATALHVISKGSRLSRHRCSSLLEGFITHFHPPVNGFGMAINKADPPRKRTNGVEVGREKVWGLVWNWAYLCKVAPYISHKPIRADWAFLGGGLKETGTKTELSRQMVNTGLFRQTVGEKQCVFEH